MESRGSSAPTHAVDDENQVAAVLAEMDTGEGDNVENSAGPAGQIMNENEVDGENAVVPNTLQTTNTDDEDTQHNFIDLTIDRPINLSELKEADSYLLWILQHANGADHSHLLNKLKYWTENLVDVSSTPSNHIGQQFLLFTLELLDPEDHGLTEDMMRESEHKIDTAVENMEAKFSPEQYQMLKYINISNKAAVFYHLATEQNVDNSENMRRAEEYMTEIASSFGGFLYTSKRRAIGLGLEADLMLLVGRISESLDRLRKAQILDPDSVDILQSLYTAARSLRRENDWNDDPSEEEVRSIIKAYDISPNASTVLLRMSTLLEDLLARDQIPKVVENMIGHTTVHQLTRTLQKIVMTALNLYPDNVVIQSRFSEFLASGPGRDDDACDKYLSEAIAKWPTNGQVLYKRGKFFAINKNQLDRGATLLKHSLTADPKNFMTLMTYIKCMVKQGGRKWNETLKTIDEYIGGYDELPLFRQRLLYVKGSILWSIRLKYKQAIDCWLEAFFTKFDKPIIRTKLLDNLAGASITALNVEFDLVIEKVNEMMEPQSERSHLLYQFKRAIIAGMDARSRRLAPTVQ